MNIRGDPEILKVLGLETLESRKSDKLDFHDMACWIIGYGIELAYQKGYAQGIEDHLGSGQWV